MSFATTIPLLLGLVIWAGILALVIYLAVLLIKALRKYLKSGPVRQEKAEMARSLGGGHQVSPHPLQDDPGVRGGVPGREPSGGEQVGERRRRSQHLQPAGPGQALRSFGGGAAEKRGMTSKTVIACPGRGRRSFYWTHQEAERAFCPCCQSLLKRCSSTSSTMSAETTDTPAKMR